MAGTPPSSRGITSSLFGEQAIAAPDATHTGLVVAGGVGAAETQDVFEVWDDGSNTNVLLGVNHLGKHTIRESTGAAQNYAALRVLGNASVDDKLSVQKAGVGELLTVTGAAADPFVIVGSPAALKLSKVAAPADAALAASEAALWLDATPGVGNTKLMVKAKDSGGTVRTAAIVLA